MERGTQVALQARLQEIGGNRSLPISCTLPPDTGADLSERRSTLPPDIGADFFIQCQEALYREGVTWKNMKNYVLCCLVLFAQVGARRGGWA